jgi:hypothetical protein
MMEAAPNNGISSLLDTKPKRIHLVFSILFLIVVAIGTIGTLIGDNEGSIPQIAVNGLLMGLSIVSSLFVMRYVETRAPSLRRLAYIFIPIASLLIVFWLKSQHHMWWKADLAYWVVAYSTLFCSLGIPMLIAIPMIIVWKWVNAV